MVRNFPVIYAPGGVDLRTMHPLRNPQAGVTGLNFDVTSTLNLVKRKGYAMKADHDLGYGLALYEEWTTTDALAIGWGKFSFGLDPWGSPTSLGLGNIEPKIMGLGTVPKVWTLGTFAITYSGAGAATLLVSATSGSDITLVLSVDGSAVLTSDLGDGTEGSPVDMTALKTAVDAIADFSATITGTATTPAAFLDWVPTTSLTSGTAQNIGFGYWTTVNTTNTSPMPATESRKAESNYENPDWLNMNGVLYVSNGYDAMHKYDGQNFYKAGIEDVSSILTPTVTGVSVAAGMSGSYRYRVRYKHVDQKFNTIYGAISNPTTAVDNSAGPYAIDVVVPNIVAATGYSTHCAVSDGAQASTTVGVSQERLTVDDGSGGAHTVVAGDTVYLKDNIVGYQTYEVVSVTSTTITLSSAGTVNVDDGIVISANLIIQVFRTEGGGTLYKLVEELPNNSFTSNQTYRDTLVDSSLGTTFVPPSKVPNIPPKCKYMAVWRNQLVLAGAPGSPTSIYYSEFSDQTSPENFPNINIMQISPELSGSVITALSVIGRNLLIFTESAVYIAEGNLADDLVRIDLLTDDVGCVAHATIGKFENSVVFLTKKGIYRISPGGSGGYSVSPISLELDPILRLDSSNNFATFYQRAVGKVWTRLRKYILYLPEETTDGDIYGNANSRCYVYDFDLKQWYIWSNINALSGMLVHDDGNSDEVIWFHSREVGPKNRLYRFNNTGDEIDYADHVQAVDFSYQTQWEFGNDPRGYKVYTSIGFDMLRGSAQLNYTPSGTLSVGVRRDFDDLTTEATFPVDFLANDQQVICSLPRSARRAISLNFSNSTINEQILISGWAFEMFRYGRGIRR